MEERRMIRKGSLLVLCALLLVVGACKEGDDPAVANNTPSASPVPAGTVNDYGGSLIIAASKSDLPAVKALVAKGKNVNEKSPNGTTPIMEAAWVGNMEMLKFLVEKGADVNAKQDNGTTALKLAKAKGQADVIQFLESSGAK
jgi:ankyrin repeat protein